MSTRSATIVRQSTYWGEEAETEELMRFYRHSDGYPEGHGIDMAESIVEVDGMGIDIRVWCQPFLAKFLAKPCVVEFEPKGRQHGDLDYLYVVESIVDQRWGATTSGKLPTTISVYSIGLDENYADVEEREPIFSGTAYEYIKRFGKGNDD